MARFLMMENVSESLEVGDMVFIVGTTLCLYDVPLRCACMMCVAEVLGLM